MITAEPTASELAGDIFQAIDDEDHRRFLAIADCIEADPSLLSIALENIERWLANGHSSVARLEGWRQKIELAQVSNEGLASLLRLLRDRKPDAVQWKGFSPFAGVVQASQR